MFGLKGREAAAAKKEPTSIDVSLPPVKEVYGVLIQEQPVREYLNTVRRLGGILYEIFDAVFPKETPGQVFASLMTMSADGMKDLLIRIMAVAPEKALDILAAIMGTTSDHLASLSPYKLACVCQEFWAVNSLSDVFQMARGALAPALRAMKTQAPGSSD